jgi:hypothetical protein
MSWEDWILDEALRIRCENMNPYNSIEAVGRSG